MDGDFSCSDIVEKFLFKSVRQKECLNFRQYLDVKT